LIPLIIFRVQAIYGWNERDQVFYVGNHFRNIVNVVLNYLFMVFGFSRVGDCWRRDRNDSITFCNAWVYALYDAKKEKFQPFSRSFLKTSKEASILHYSIRAPSAMQMFFEVGLFTGAVWLSGVLGIINQAANQIALSLATFTFMFAMGLCSRYHSSW
jgi:MATE family multidrug resistance protein